MSTLLLIVGLLMAVLLFLFWANEQVMRKVRQDEALDNRPLRLIGEDEQEPARPLTER